MDRFPRLFTPMVIGSRQVKNRIVSTAHGTRYDRAGLLTPDYVEYYTRKAAGGVGLLVTFGSASVHPASTPAYGAIRLWDHRNEAQLRRLAENAHRHGAMILAQATHQGRRGSSFTSGQPVAAPSAEAEPVHGDIPHVLTIPEIRGIVAAFRDAAIFLEACGWDGIEVTSLGGHLIEQFWSPAVNHRQDEYGGDLHGRMRFSVEVLQAIADSVSERFVVAFRMTGDPLTDAVALSRDDMVEIATRIDKVGRVNVFSISGGTGATLEAQAATVPGEQFARGCHNHLAGQMRQALSVPVILAGRILDPAQAEQALAAGECDLVAMTRAIIADPDLPLLAQRGATSEIRPCTAMSQDCIGRVTQGLPMRCTVNPAIGPTPRPAPRMVRGKRRVAIAGAGPAGMEAARTAAEYGHDVILFERDGHLGGQLSTAALAPDRPSLRGYVEWLARSLSRLPVDVHLNTEATATLVREARPHIVVIATGSRDVLPAEALAPPGRSATDRDLLTGRVIPRPGWTVLIYDLEGSIRGSSAALLAREAGASVELVTPLASPCAGIDPFQRGPVLRDLATRGVACNAERILNQTKDEPLQLVHRWTRERRTIADLDLIVYIGYRTAQDSLGHELCTEQAPFKVEMIGDCYAPRRLMDAISEGSRAGMAS
jgi:2,4-dienoyl-CoA reductase-like NADH-dependent reductase (Old Yellow Enzyme family)